MLDLIKRLGLVLLLLSLSRLFFYFFNLSHFSDVGTAGLLKAMAVGMRFDISVVIYFNLIIILMHLLPVGSACHNKYYRAVVLFLYVTVNSLLVFINLADTVFYHFTLKRSTFDVFSFIFTGHDVWHLIPRFAGDYWFVPVTFIFTALVLGTADRLIDRRVQSTPEKGMKSIASKLVMMIFLLGLFLIGGRGGLQGRPLSIMHASAFTSARLSPIVLNTPFTLLKTAGRESIPLRTYFPPEELPEYYRVVKTGRPDEVFKPRNIVILLLESFSKEYVGFQNDYPGYTPFLDSLAQHALVFTNAFANGYRSMDAMPAVLTSVPCLMNDPIITSSYNTNEFTAFASLLKKKSYTTAFFHGGNEGTLDLDGFARQNGFDYYFGRTEYNNDTDNDGYWGIYDEPFLQYVIRNIDSFPRPFFVTEFTLSSHYPYNLPEKYRDVFKEGPLRIHRVVRYTDFALRCFLDTAKTRSWYDSTLFVLLADHPAQSVIPSKADNIDGKDNLPDVDKLRYYINSSGRYAIPLLFFSPGDSSLRGEVSTTIQQTDLMPTLLNLLNYEGSYIAFGSDVFDSTAVHVAFQFVNGIYQITSGNYCLLFDGHQPVALYDKADLNHEYSLLEDKPLIADSLSNILKACLQEYTYRMRNNNLVVREKVPDSE